MDAVLDDFRRCWIARLAMPPGRRCRHRVASAGRASVRRVAGRAAGRGRAASWHHDSQLQAEMTGRMQTMAEHSGAPSGRFARGLGERLDAPGAVGQAIERDRQQDAGSPGEARRAAGRDRPGADATSATSPSKDGLAAAILSNKQTRGAFGQGRMEAIVGDGLPHGGYEFQTRSPTTRGPTA